MVTKAVIFNYILQNIYNLCTMNTFRCDGPGMDCYPKTRRNASRNKFLFLRRRSELRYAGRRKLPALAWPPDEAAPLLPRPAYPSTEA